MPASSAHFWRAVGGLGFTQIVAWGCVYYPVSVTGPQIARDLGLSQAVIYAAYAALLLASASVAPFVGRAIDRFGGRPVLATGCLVAAVALLATAAAAGITSYILCSLFLGLAAAMTLYDAAFPAVVEATNPRGRRAITLVTFAGGFASTVSWPITAILAGDFGWRVTYVVYAVVMVLVCLPANWFALARPAATYGDTPADIGTVLPRETPPAKTVPPEMRARVLMLLGLTVSANQVVAAGFLIHIIDLSQRLGMSSREAIFLGMLFGPAQVLGRIGEMAFGGRFSPVATGRVATAALPVALIGLLPGEAGFVTGVIYALALGLSNGLMTIARGTIALSLFGPVGYGATMGKLTVPTLIARAAGPFAFALLIEYFGVQVTVAAGLVLAFVACVGMEMVARIARAIPQEE